MQILEPLFFIHLPELTFTVAIKEFVAVCISKVLSGGSCSIVHNEYILCITILQIRSEMQEESIIIINSNYIVSHRSVFFKLFNFKPDKSYLIL